jgi:hypothetical protein
MFYVPSRGNKTKGIWLMHFEFRKFAAEEFHNASVITNG